MAKTSWKAGTMLYPLPPVMVSCGTMEKPNVFTVAWTGIINSEPAMTYISVRPSRYSYDLIKQSGEFVINLTTAGMLKAADFCGVKSGRDTDKFDQTGLTPAPCGKVRAPMIAESPVSLECRVTEIKPLGSHDMFLAEIAAVNVDDKLLDADGLFRLEKSGLVAFCHGGYYALGDKIGTFGFSVAKKKTRKQRISEIKHERRSLKKQKQKETPALKQEETKPAKAKKAFSPDKTKRPSAKAETPFKGKAKKPSAGKTKSFRKPFNKKKAP